MKKTIAPLHPRPCHAFLSTLTTRKRARSTSTSDDFVDKPYLLIHRNRVALPLPPCHEQRAKKRIGRRVTAVPTVTFAISRKKKKKEKEMHPPRKLKKARSMKRERERGKDGWKMVVRMMVERSLYYLQ